MSRTWKTRPLKVSMWDSSYKKIKMKAYHDHRNGACDLPDNYKDDRVNSWPNSNWYRMACSWGFVYTGRSTCACPGCSWCRPEYKRAGVKGEMREALRLYNAGYEVD